MAGQDIVVLGGSSGSIEALSRLLSKLHPGLPACVLVVVHIPAAPSMLAHTLSRAGDLPVEFAADGRRLEAGRVLVAPPDHHLRVDGDVVRLDRGPRENGFRPAIDALFRSAALTAGPRVMAVLLSGLLDDGASGLCDVKRNGGITVVQDFDEAAFPELPLAGARRTEVDHVLPIDAIAELIERRAGLPRRPAAARAEGERSTSERSYGELEPTDLTCPECGGALHRSKAGPDQHFACHVGHVFAPESLLADQTDALDRALWTALRALEERSDLLRQMAERAEQGSLHGLADRYRRGADSAASQARTIRRVVTANGPR